METVGDRIRKELKRTGGRSIRSFQTEMHANGVHGSSYSSVHSYLRKENPAQPSLEFVRAAAELLGCREEWLTDGTGERTDQEDRMADAAGDDSFQKFRKALDGTPFYNALGEDFDLQVSFAMLAGRLGAQEMDGEFQEAFLEGLSSLILQPFQLLNPASQGGGEETIPLTYIRTMLVALNEVLPSWEHRMADDGALLKLIAEGLVGYDLVEVDDDARREE